MIKAAPVRSDDSISNSGEKSKNKIKKCQEIKKKKRKNRKTKETRKVALLVWH